MNKNSSKKRIPIPSDVRQRLWIAAAGRCQFKGCGKPVGIDFLTGKAKNLGELAHIIADSPLGPRGDPIKSKLLATDVANLMLTCFDCHKRIDDLWAIEEYPAELLQKWKREQESKVKAIYETEVRTESLPVIVTWPIANQGPEITVKQIHTAILKNSEYGVFPAYEPVVLNRSDFDIRDDDPLFWSSAERALTKWYERVLEPKILGKDAPPHLSIAAFGPIPLLMKIGSLIGDKRPTMVLDLPNNNWLWRFGDKSLEPAEDMFEYAIPETLPLRVFVAVEVSNKTGDTGEIVGDTPLVKFSAKNPVRELIKNPIQLDKFRSLFNNFLTELHRAGVREIDLLPVTSLSASVEIGRLLLPKIFNRVSVWEYQKQQWRQALDLTNKAYS